jgi:CRISPR system Cascade subunit CasC
MKGNNMSLVIDVHALQTLPPSLINRDDTGAPKSADFGGVPRQRVSSQSWKRAIRKDFEANFDPSYVGLRSRRVVDLVVAKIKELQEADGNDVWSDERATKDATALFKSAGIKTVEQTTKVTDDNGEETDTTLRPQTGYLLFLSPRQIENAARAVIDADGAKIGKKDAGALLNQEHSVDIAMFGRMVADDATYNVDASVQVGHALGIHESEPEFDYFTAVDDAVEDNQETGAGMIGTIQMMSSTLYRFATIDVESLSENLGSRSAAETAAVAFVDSFIRSLPTGKQNTFAHNTLPELVYVTVRNDRSISLVNAFEEPVSGDGTTGRRKAGAKRLAGEAKQIQTNYGFEPTAAFVIGLGEMTDDFTDLATVTTLPELGGLVREAIAGGES